MYHTKSFKFLIFHFSFIGIKANIFCTGPISIGLAREARAAGPLILIGTFFHHRLANFSVVRQSCDLLRDANIGMTPDTSHMPTLQSRATVAVTTTFFPCIQACTALFDCVECNQTN